MKKYKLLVIALMFAIAACKEESGHGPITPGGPAPEPVTNIKVVPTPGGGRFKYLIPTSPDALYIKAVYESPKGVFKEVKSSIYSDSLNIEGLGTSNEYEVKFYTVSKSEQESAPAIIKFNPLPSPIQIAFPSLTLEPDLGGAIVNYLNPDGKRIEIRVITKGPSGRWEINEILYTTQKSGFFNARGLPSTPTQFGVYITDRFKNSTDTLVKTITPLFEERIDTRLWKPVIVNAEWNNEMWRDITNYYFGTAVLTEAWDNDMLDEPRGYMQSITSTGTAQPGSPESKLSFTIDLGKSYRLSRLKVWPRGVVQATSALYNVANVEQFHLVGSTDGITWVPLLLNNKIVKPSGLPTSQNTPEDIDYAVKGFDFVFPSNVPSIRYFRWLNYDTFGNLRYIAIQELALWSK